MTELVARELETVGVAAPASLPVHTSPREPRPSIMRAGVRATRTVKAVVDLVRDLGADYGTIGHTPEDLAVRTARTTAVARRLCRVHNFQVKTTGVVPKDGAILVANHLSYLDPILIASHLSCTAVAKIEVKKWPLLGPALEGLGAIWVDRSDPLSGAAALLRARRFLELGANVLAFPEGTTTFGDELLPFKRGLFGLARLLERPVVPISLNFERRELCWVGDELFLPHYVRTSSRASWNVHLHFGQPMDPRHYESANFFADVARAEIGAHMAVSAA